MATRLYLPISGTAPSTPDVDLGWAQTIGAFARRPTATTKAQNSTLTDFAALHGSTLSGATCWMQWVSAQLSADTRISGTISAVVRGLEGSLTENAHLALVVRVMQGDTGKVRGTLLRYLASSTEFVATAATRIHSARAVSPVDALAGDRICIEIGIYAVSPDNEAENTLRFGDVTATSDFALTADLTTDLIPWVELSQTLSFGTVTTTTGFTAQVVIGRARRLLADDLAAQGAVVGERWNDAELMDFVNEGAGELATRLPVVLLQDDGSVSTLTDVTALDDRIPFPTKWIGVVADWVVYRALSEDGAETENAKRGSFYLARFDLNAGGAT